MTASAARCGTWPSGAGVWVRGQTGTGRAVVVVGATVVVVLIDVVVTASCFEWPQPLTIASAAEAARTADTRRAPGGTLISGKR